MLGLLGAELSARDFRAYTRARTDKGRSPSTVSTELSRLRHCLRWAYSERLIETPVNVWIPSRGPGRKLTITFEQAQALLRCAGDAHIGLFILRCLLTEARKTAICELTWDRVDFEEGLMNFNQSAERDPLKKSYKKGRAVVPMSSLLRQHLLVAKRGRQTDHVIEHGGRPVKDPRAGFANAVARAGLPRAVTPTRSVTRSQHGRASKGTTSIALPACSGTRTAGRPSSTTRM